jgi:hypothetical protein
MATMSVLEPAIRLAKQSDAPHSCDPLALPALYLMHARHAEFARRVTLSQAGDPEFQRRVMLNRDASGILDAPLSRSMTAELAV